VPLNGATRVFLGMSINREEMQFRYSLDGKIWNNIGPVCDMTILSDEYATRHPEPGWGFTGALIALCCQDISGKRLHADFDYLDYRANE